MELTLKELSKRANKTQLNLQTHYREQYHLARRLGFSSYEALHLQSQKREVILRLAVEKGLIKDSNDPKIGG